MMKKGFVSLLIMVTALMVAATALAAPNKAAPTQEMTGILLDDGVLK